MRRSKSIAIAGTACLTVILAACTTDHLAFTTYTKVGLDISSIEKAPAQMTFGYKRYEGAIVPVGVDNSQVAVRNGDPKTKLPNDVASVYAEMFIDNSWLRGLTIKQKFATGEAANQAANSGE